MSAAGTQAAADASARDVISAALNASVHRLIAHEDVARAGRDPEGVHQARVATRRLRSDLRTFRPLLDSAWADGLRAELRSFADGFGAVRDADVLLDRLEVAAAALPPGQHREAAVLLAALRRARTAARRRMLAMLNSRAYSALRDELRVAATSPRCRSAAHVPAADVLPGLARKPWRKLQSDAAKLGPGASDEELHQLRIRVKRARYAAEAVAAVGPPEVSALAKALGSLQDALGLHHDAVVAAQWVSDTSERLGRGGTAAAALADVEQAYADGWRREWPQQWRAARRTRPRGW